MVCISMLTDFMFAFCKFLNELNVLNSLENLMFNPNAGNCKP